MARVKRSVGSKKHRRAVLEEAKGYSGARGRHFRKANEQVMHSLQYAYRDRRAKKGEFRRLWIVRINAACRENGIAYSRFVAGLKAGWHALVDVFVVSLTVLGAVLPFLVAGLLVGIPVWLGIRVLLRRRKTTAATSP